MMAPPRPRLSPGRARPPPTWSTAPWSPRPPALTATDALRLARTARRRRCSRPARAAGCCATISRAPTALGVGALPIAPRWRARCRWSRARESEVARPPPSRGRGARSSSSRERRAAPLGVVRPRAAAGTSRRCAAPARAARSTPSSRDAARPRSGRLAAAHGARAFAVGGLVRDALARARRPTRHDLDVVVEGDAPRRRARAGRRARRHAGRARALPHRVGRRCPIGRRVDVVTARSERYERPGALPRVLPAPIAQDLRRRDFTVNAMAVELGSGAFGLLDPLGGGADLARRRLRVLHPLSFVEDPTRIFRAARYAARLGFALDALERARPGAGAVAWRRIPRCRRRGSSAELERDPRATPRRAPRSPGSARAGAFRLLDPRLPAHARRRWRASRALPADARLGAGARRAGVRRWSCWRAALAADQPAGGRAGGAARGSGSAARRSSACCETLAQARRRWPRGWPARRDRATRRATLRGAESDSRSRGCWLAGDAARRERARPALGGESQARGPRSSGDDVIALGVPRGPGRGARCSAALRDARLDGRNSRPAGRNRLR